MSSSDAKTSRAGGARRRERGRRDRGGAARRPLVAGRVVPGTSSGLQMSDTCGLHLKLIRHCASATF